MSDYDARALCESDGARPVVVRTLESPVAVCVHGDGSEHVLEPDDDGLVTYPCDGGALTPPPAGGLASIIGQGRTVLRDHSRIRDLVDDLEVELRKLDPETRARARRYIVAVYLTPYAI